MSAILSYKGTVYPWHCDHMGHMNVMWYAGKFDVCDASVGGPPQVTPVS